jgi:hypothetical protein
MGSPERPDYSQSLPRPLVIPGVMTLRTLADLRELLRHLPTETKGKATWQKITALVDEVAAGSVTPADVAAALEMVLILEKIPFRQK